MLSQLESSLTQREFATAEESGRRMNVPIHE